MTADFPLTVRAIPLHHNRYEYRLLAGDVVIATTWRQLKEGESPDKDLLVTLRHLFFNHQQENPPRYYDDRGVS